MEPILPEPLPEERIALEINRLRGRVTARALMERAHISKATATRRLTELVERGVLTRVGQGRATSYIRT